MNIRHRFSRHPVLLCAANFGWIDPGDGAPANGHTYSNTSATDFGVNLAASGALTGYAYAARFFRIVAHPPLVP